MEDKDWFVSWFDTEYYHILYRSRNDDEAEKFIDNLLRYLELPAKTRVLDLACGKGRHSKTMAQKGMEVVGADLSENSINAARSYENENLRFVVQDMRLPLHEKFDAVFNLFTSFGYFDDLGDNRKVIEAVNKMLQTNGYFVIDFMNAYRVAKHLVASEIKEIDGIRFEIERSFDGHHIFKNIRFSDKGKNYHFTERVQYLSEDDFRNLLLQNGFSIQDTFGDFELNPFDPETSDRLIIIAKKTT